MTVGDEELVERFRGGAPDAFAELYRRHNREMVRWFTRWSWTEPDEAEDLAHEVWCRLCLDPSRLPVLQPERGTFRQWLHSVARNLAIDTARKRARRPALSLESLSVAQLESVRPVSGAVPGTAAAEEAFDPEEYIGPLDERERALLRLLLEGVPTAEICERLGLSQPTVWRIRKRLQDRLRPS